MRPAPTLVPVPPTAGSNVTIDRSPFWIGSGAGCALRVHLPTVSEKHASITEREDGFYLSPQPGARTVRLGGQGVAGPVKLIDGAVLELGPTARWEFVSGEPRAAPRQAEPEAEEPEPAAAPRRWARPRRGRSRAGFPLWALAAIVLLAGAGVVGGVLLYRALTGGGEEAQGPPPLTQQEGELYDQLMAEATRSIERGSMLLDLGLDNEAVQEFTRAHAVFETSILAQNPWVRPSIEALVASAREIYQAKKGSVPAGLRGARGKVADLSRVMASALSVDQFALAVDLVKGAFQARFGKEIFVTGRDHPEHLSLYGAGGALDIRVRDLAREQIDFLIDRFKAAGIRVKDFSRDEVLQAQIAAARARGWSDRAGTGLHLHIDRFRDRRDRWTV